MLLKKITPCNSKEVHKAVSLACIASGGLFCGASYALKADKLIIAFNSTKTNPYKHPNAHKALQVLAANLPKSYGTKFQIWELERWRSKVPEKVQKRTGHVSVYHPDCNII